MAVVGTASTYRRRALHVFQFGFVDRQRQLRPRQPIELLLQFAVTSLACLALPLGMKKISTLATAMVPARK